MASNPQVFTYADVARRANSQQIKKFSMRSMPVPDPRHDATFRALDFAWKRFNDKHMEKHQSIGTYAHSVEVARQEINDAHTGCTTRMPGCTEQDAVNKLLRSLTPAFDTFKIQHDHYFGSKRMPSWKRALEQLLEFERGLIVRANKRFPFTNLPRELRDVVYSMILSGRVEVSVSKYEAGTDPGIVAAVAQLGGQRSRLEFILALMERSVFKVTTLDEAEGLQLWLASIDFTLVNTIDGADLKDGFDAVRTLFLSDINRCRRHFIQVGDKYQYKDVTVEASAWNDDIALMRKCKNLHTVELDCALGFYIIEALKTGRDVDLVMKGYVIGKHHLQKVLDLRRVKVIHLHFFTADWTSCSFTREQEQRVIDWLTAEFQKLGETVHIISEWEFWAQDWS